MGFLDLFRRKSLTTTSPFAFLLGLDSPVTKSREALNSYTSWVYACTSAIADEIATIEFRKMRRIPMVDTSLRLASVLPATLAAQRSSRFGSVPRVEEPSL